MGFNIFATLTRYASKWSPTGNRPFTQEEIDAVERVQIVASTYGNSACFFMKGGGQCYIPMSRDASKGVGETFDMKDARLLTLERDGDDPITRVVI